MFVFYYTTARKEGTCGARASVMVAAGGALYQLSDEVSRCCSTETLNGEEGQALQVCEWRHRSECEALGASLRDSGRRVTRATPAVLPSVVRLPAAV